MASSPSHRRQGKEGNCEDGEAGGDYLAHPGPGHRVAVADRRHRDLKVAEIRHKIIYYPSERLTVTLGRHPLDYEMLQNGVLCPIHIVPIIVKLRDLHLM